MPNIKRITVCVMLLCVKLTMLPPLSADALGTLPAKNTEPRHQVCTALSQEAQAYYSGAYRYDALSALDGAENTATSYEAMQNNPTFDALHALMSDTHTYYSTYAGYSKGSLAYFWASTDATAATDSYVMFYSDVPSGGDYAMNREHIWPKSLASFHQKGGGADLHHLRPAVDRVNNAKSDHFFGNINGVYPDGYTTGALAGNTVYYVSTGRDMFECKDDVKGDVARILLYVYCRWEQPNLYTSMTENLPSPDPDDTVNNGGKVIESLDTLLEWCAQDPVDTWEMKRNDLVQQVQGNRNVFIDYPELAWQLFDEEPPAGMATPTSQGCEHRYVSAGHSDPTCTEAGCDILECTLCGNRKTIEINPLGHLDENDDDICDRCGAELAIPAHMARATALANGDHLVLYHTSTKTSLSAAPDGKGRLLTTPAAIKNGLLNPTDACASLTVRSAGNDSLYLLHKGKYLTTAATGRALSLTDAPDDYSLWRLTPCDNGTQVFIDSVNAQTADGATMRLQFYGGSGTVYTAGTTPAFRFEPYTRREHLWDEGVITVPPTPVQSGVIVHTCRLCGTPQEESLPALRLRGDTDGDGAVTVSDATLIQRYLAEYDVADESRLLSCGDTDGNGKVSIRDVTAIQRYLAEFADPYAIGQTIIS